MGINLIGISGGKDSTALLLWARYESGYETGSVRAIYNAHSNDPQETLDYVQMLSERVHPVEFIKPPMDFYQLAYHKKRFPSRRARFCTEQLKLEPTREYIRTLQREGHEVVIHSGVRADESRERALLPESDWDDYFDCEVLRPLLRWVLADVWAIHERYDIQPNPLYALGSKRVGCLPCIMSRKSELRMIGRLFPERVTMIREAENRFIEIHGEPRTFFHRTTTTAPFRSLTVTQKDGQSVPVPTIDDVILWSQTSRGGKQFEFDFEDEELSDDIGICASQYGVCE